MLGYLVLRTEKEGDEEVSHCLAVIPHTGTVRPLDVAGVRAFLGGPLSFQRWKPDADYVDLHGLMPSAIGTVAAVRDDGDAVARIDDVDAWMEVAGPLAEPTPLAPNVVVWVPRSLFDEDSVEAVSQEIAQALRVLPVAHVHVEPAEQSDDAISVYVSTDAMLPEDAFVLRRDAERVAAKVVMGL